MSAVMVGYARTPFVKVNGVFAAEPATRLGAHAIAAALRKAGVDAADVERVFGGQVLQGGAGQNPARQAAVAAGIPMSTPAITLNAVCLSGMEAIANGMDLIESGRAATVVAFGQESMSLAPHAWPGSRAGHRYGAIEMLDTMEHDGLTDAFEHRSMGASTESHNGTLGLGREEQDAWAAGSHQRLAASGAFLDGEIAPYDVRGRRGVTTISADDGLRADTTTDTLGRLRPAFSKDGTVTAGNSSQITDGAAAVVLMDEGTARRRGLTPIARLLTHAMVAGPDVYLHEQPSNAITAALHLAGLTAGDLAAIEINEAFAAVAVRSTSQLAADPTIVNTHGGAIALGHPIGASGTRIVGHLARRLAASTADRAIGSAGICGGGGQGSAIVLQRI